MKLTLAHARTGEEAFLFFALREKRIDTGGYDPTIVTADEQTLNDDAVAGRFAVSTLSAHAYALAADKYVPLNAGMLSGDGYGPIVAARTPLAADDLRGRRVAAAGATATGFLLLQLYLGDDTFEPRFVSYADVPDDVGSGKSEAGLLAHGEQFVAGMTGLSRVLDLGQWWRDRTGMPLPLRLVAARRDLADEQQRDVAQMIRDSARYALEHREEALRNALPYADGLERAMLDRVIGECVNQRTIECDADGVAGIQKLLGEGAAAGLVPTVGAVELVG